MVAIEPIADFAAWARDEWTRRRWGLPTLAHYSEPSEAAPAGANRLHVLDYRPFRDVLRAYKRVVAEEGSHAAARTRIASYAILGLLCVAGIITLWRWAHGQI